MTKAICTTEDCKVDGELEREVHKGLKNKEFLFKQRRPVGLVAIQLHSMMNQEGFDVFYLCTNDGFKTCASRRPEASDVIASTIRKSSKK